MTKLETLASAKFVTVPQYFINPYPAEPEPRMLDTLRDKLSLEGTVECLEVRVRELEDKDATAGRREAEFRVQLQEQLDTGEWSTVSFGVSYENGWRETTRTQKRKELDRG